MLNHSEEYKNAVRKKLDNAFAKESKSFLGFFIKNYRVTYLIILTFLSLGIYSLVTLPREAEPEVRVPYAVVTTIYPGATPKDVEELVTDKLEEKIKNLENLDTYTSSSGQGFSSIFIQYNAEADLQDSFQKLREAVDNAAPTLPEEAEIPTVTEINLNDTPIVTYSLVGEYSDTELKKYADILQDEFESIKDVSSVSIIGGQTREFQILVSQTKLTHYGISTSQIINSINSSNFNMPAGDIDIDGFNYSVRVEGKIFEATQLNNIVIATYDGSPIFLSDVAEIKDTFKEKESESKIALKGENAKNAISLQIYKKTGGNILNIAKDAEKIVDESHKNNIIPTELEIIKTNDNSKLIRKDLYTLGTSGLQTFFLIGLILFVILSFRGAIITAMAVPIAFMMSFFFLNVQDMTLNSMVLFALVLSLGLMVDNSIIVIEGINEYIKDHKKSVFEAAILSVWNFKWAIIAGTMTTVSAFVPMLLVSGIMGEYMSILPKTISVTLLSSLFVALIIIPTLASRFIKVSDTNDENKSHRNQRRHKVIGNNISKLQKAYVNFQKSILPNKKKRQRFITTVWILFMVSVAMPIIGVMEIQMFSTIDFDYFSINIELPIGSTLDKTKVVTEEVEKVINDIPELDNYVANIGNSASMGYGSNSSNGSHLSSITLNLVDEKERKRKSYEIADSIRPKLAKIQGATISVEELKAGPPSGSALEIRISGNDTKELANAASEVEKYLETVTGVINVKNNLENSSGEFTFKIDKQKANYYGLSTVSIASILRNAIYGNTVSTVNIDSDDIDIVLKYQENSFTNINDLENILLPTSNGAYIPIKEIAKLSLEPALLSIAHRNGDKVVTVSADINQENNSTKVAKQFNDNIQELNIPNNVNVEIGGENEDIDKSFREIFLSMIVAVLLIAFILVLQFNSFKQPFIIIFALPLAVIGSIWGLIALGQAFSFPAFIGIVSLSGIVVNDAIVLIDRINKNIADGLAMIDAICEAGTARLQPILVTSITTIAGIFPLIYADEMWKGLSLTIIFGLMFSTILILVIIPMIYFGITPTWSKKKTILFWLTALTGVFSTHIFYQGKKVQGAIRLGIYILSIAIIILKIPGPIATLSHLTILTLAVVANIELFRTLVLMNDEIE